MKNTIKIYVYQGAKIWIACIIFFIIYIFYKLLKYVLCGHQAKISGLDKNKASENKKKDLFLLLCSQLLKSKNSLLLHK